MERFHRLLLDQIKHHGVYAWTDVARRRAFLHAVSDAYHRHDTEQAELERTLDANTTELLNTSIGLQAMMRALPDQFFRLDADGVILDYWPGSGRHLAIDVADPTARCLYDFVSDETAWRFRDSMTGVLASGELRCFEFSEGEDRHLEVRLFPVMQDQVVALVRDVADRKYSEQRIAHLAYHDSLTGLPNRLLFKDRLELSIAFARRHGDMVAVMFLDLDRFKQINDTLGHGIGDQLLVTVARRLRESLRVTGAVTRIDENRSEMPVTIARMGGDEFTIILSEVADVQEVVKVARQVLEVISRPFELGGGEVYVTASIGIALFPEDGADFETLVKNADAAMYHAKECGRNNYQIFTESMNAAAFERLMLESHLHRAVQRGEFEVHYQPLMDVASGRVVSLEALLRWRHPEMGMIGPNLFIPLAEESDLILEVGDWLAREVCRQIRTWRDAGLVPHRVFLNISGQQMRPDHLLPTLMDALAENRLDSHFLGIELTETSIVAFPNATSSLLRHARKLGMKVAIDDFGTGYSGLSYLQSFPVDLLKIDKSFVGTISPEGGDGRLAAAIIALGHNLGLEVVAEGVETDCQLEFLRENGCDKVQGYLICRPAPAGNVEYFLQDGPILSPAAAPLGE